MGKTKVREHVNDPEWLSKVDQAVSKAAKELAEEIDFSVLADMLEESGWVSVELPFWTNSKDPVDVEVWLFHTCKGEYKKYKRRYLFKNAQDATWFKLRWLS